MKQCKEMGEANICLRNYYKEFIVTLRLIFAGRDEPQRPKRIQNSRQRRNVYLEPPYHVSPQICYSRKHRGIYILHARKAHGAIPLVQKCPSREHSKPYALQRIHLRHLQIPTSSLQNDPIRRR